MVRLSDHLTTCLPVMTQRFLTDNTCERADTDAVWKDYIVLPLGASISMISYAIIFYFYYIRKVPTLKRHPTCMFQI